MNQVRRRDRAVEDETWIRRFLHEARYGVVASVCEGQPYLNPLLFVYDEESNAILFHTARGGRIHSNISGNGRVCFCVSEMGRLIGDEEACAFDVEYASVIVLGRACVLEEEAEAGRALGLLVRKYFPEAAHGEGGKPIPPEQAKRPAVYRVDIESWSGKRNAL